MFAEYNRKHADDPAKELNLDAASFSSERCEFKRVQIYEHIDDQIREGNVFRAWLSSNDSFEKEYKVTYPTKEESKKMEEEARELNRAKRLEKEAKWDKKRKIEKKEENWCVCSVTSIR